MKHNYAIDCYRLLAAFGVILIHLGPSTSNAEYLTQFFALSAVPFFIITSLYIFQAKGTSLHKIKYARIIIPYISWSLIYLFSRQLKTLIVGTTINHDWIGVLFFGEACVQLYFLPLILCFQILAAVITILLTNKDSKPSKKILSLLLVVLLLALNYAMKDAGYTGFGNHFFLQGVQYILFAGSLINCLPDLMVHRRWLALLSFTSLILLLYWGVESASFYRDFVSALIATFILSICLIKPVYVVPEGARSILSTTYGIFLCHPLFIESFEVLMHKLSIDFLPYSVFFKLTFAAFIMVVCILFVLTVRRCSPLSFLLLGETPKKPLPS